MATTEATFIGTTEGKGEFGSGYCEDGRPYIPGIPCLHCGKFVGRDGSIAVEHFEMSSEIASVEGECARCLATDQEAHPERYGWTAEKETPQVPSSTPPPDEAVYDGVQELDGTWVERVEVEVDGIYRITVETPYVEPDVQATLANAVGAASEAGAFSEQPGVVSLRYSLHQGPESPAPEKESPDA